jgi:hypothetical protein
VTFPRVAALLTAAVLGGLTAPVGAHTTTAVVVVTAGSPSENALKLSKTSLIPVGA